MLDDILKDASPWAWLGGAGVMGRIIFHARQVQAGARKPITMALFWDLPIGLGMGWIVLGLSSYIGLDHEPAMSLAMVFSYMGPYSIDRAVAKWADWKWGKQDEN